MLFAFMCMLIYEHVYMLIYNSYMCACVLHMGMIIYGHVCMCVSWQVCILTYMMHIRAVQYVIVHMIICNAYVYVCVHTYT